MVNSGMVCLRLELEMPLSGDMRIQNGNLRKHQNILFLLISARLSCSAHIPIFIRGSHNASSALGLRRLRPRKDLLKKILNL